jgi:hypothetical protein
MRKHQRGAYPAVASIGTRAGRPLAQGRAVRARAAPTLAGRCCCASQSGCDAASASGASTCGRTEAQLRHELHVIAREELSELDARSEGLDPWWTDLYRLLLSHALVKVGRYRTAIAVVEALDASFRRSRPRPPGSGPRQSDSGRSFPAPPRTTTRQSEIPTSTQAHNARRDNAPEAARRDTVGARPLTHGSARDSRASVASRRSPLSCRARSADLRVRVCRRGRSTTISRPRSLRGALRDLGRRVVAVPMFGTRNLRRSSRVTAVAASTKQSKSDRLMRTRPTNPESKRAEMSASFSRPSFEEGCVSGRG